MVVREFLTEAQHNDESRCSVDDAKIEIEIGFGKPGESRLVGEDLA